MLAVVLLGCGVHPVSSSHLPWAAEARPTHNVRVLPVLTVYDEPEVRLDGYVGAGVSWYREGIRRQRTSELNEISEAIGDSLPGAVHGEMRGCWDGNFRVGRYPVLTRDRLAGALKGRSDLDEALVDIAQSVGGEAVLFTWITELRGDPLSAEGLPGEIIETSVGPVVVDLYDEPYRVTAEVGMALVTSDGDVVVRYADTFEAILSGASRPAHTGRDLAKLLASEVAMVWPNDPRLEIGEPRFAQR